MRIFGGLPEPHSGKVVERRRLPPPPGSSGANFAFVFFEAEGGTPQPQPLRVLWDAGIPRLRAMEKKAGGVDYGFVGWFDELGLLWDIETRRVSPQDDADGDGIVTLRAKWELNPVAVNFQTNFFTLDAPPAPAIVLSQNGEPITAPTQLLIPGGKAIEPPVMPRGDGQGLVGWFTENGLDAGTHMDRGDGYWGRQWDFASDVVFEDTALYARWSTHTRTVHLQVNGGTRPSGQEITRVNFTVYTGLGGAAGGRIIDPGPMAREGYVFGGWFTDLGYSNEWVFATSLLREVDSGMIGQDPFTLFAKWEPNVYIASFEARETANPASQRVAHGERLDRPALPANPDRVLDGWFTMDGRETGVWGRSWNFDADVARNTMTLHARWSDAEYAVRFHLGNPGGAPPHSVFLRPADQNLTSGGLALEPFMPALPASDTASWSFYRWDFHRDSQSASPADVDDPAFRAELRQWDFGLSLAEAPPGARDADGNLNLYARWVPPIPGMAWVPRGSFVMGDSGVSGSPAIYHAYPTRRVTVDGFYIGRTEVTQAQFREVMQDGNPAAAVSPLGNSVSPSNATADSDRHPVERVSWFDAIYYTILRSEQQGLAPVFRIESHATDYIPPTNYLRSIVRASVSIADWGADGYRLPTEAEWEFAARGGHGSPGGFVYAGSNNAEAVAWFNATSSNRTQPVGGKQPNALGIFDMSGNVSEWCWDALLAYRDISAQTDNPRIGDSPAGESEPRVRRGGAWSNAVSNVRSVVRNSDMPGTAHWAIGFRVARGPGETYY